VVIALHTSFVLLLSMHIKYHYESCHLILPYNYFCFFVPFPYFFFFSISFADSRATT